MPPLSEQIMVRLPTALLDQLKIIAADADRPVAYIVREAVRAYLTETEGET